MLCWMLSELQHLTQHVIKTNIAATPAQKRCRSMSQRHCWLCSLYDYVFSQLFLINPSYVTHHMCGSWHQFICDSLQTGSKMICLFPFTTIQSFSSNKKQGLMGSLREPSLYRGGEVCVSQWTWELGYQEPSAPGRVSQGKLVSGEGPD